jgi:hypothetical protein
MNVENKVISLFGLPLVATTGQENSKTVNAITPWMPGQASH